MFKCVFYCPRAYLIELFPLLLPLRTGRTEIKCAGTSVLAYAGVLRIPRWYRQNSHVTGSKTRWRSTASMWKYLHLQSAQFYLFMWLFWRTPSTLKIAKSSPLLVFYTMLISVVQTHTHAKRHQTPLKDDVASLTSTWSASPAIVRNANILNLLVLVLSNTGTLSFVYTRF